MEIVEMLPHMPGKQSANLTITGSMVRRTAYRASDGPGVVPA